MIAKDWPVADAQSQQASFRGLPTPTAPAAPAHSESGAISNPVCTRITRESRSGELTVGRQIGVGRDLSAVLIGSHWSLAVFRLRRSRGVGRGRPVDDIPGRTWRTPFPGARALQPAWPVPLVGPTLHSLMEISRIY